MADEPEDRPARLDPSDRRAVAKRKTGSSIVVHEVIRQEGREELGRPAMSLILSGLVAGVAMNASVLGKTYFRAHLPDAPWRHLVESLGYTFGFLIVVLARLKLFTESTVTAVLPVAAHPSAKGLGKLARLWGLVLAANMVGTFLVALLLATTPLLAPAERAALLSISRELLANDATRTFLLGIPAGFLIGAIAWILPNARPAEFWVVLTLTYVIGVGSMSHVIAGSTEVWMLCLDGEIALSRGLGQIILPSLAGNVVGGTFLFTALAHGQVHSELGE